MAKTAKRRPSGTRTRKPMAFALGVLIILLAIVGAGTLIKLSMNGIQKLTDDTPEKENYEAFLAPVVMNDPDPFDDVTKASMQQLIDITIWSLINDNPKPGQYEEYQDAERAGLIIPQEDIEKQFAKLFGKDIQPRHDTISGGSYDFVYEPARKGYIIPITGVQPTYTPKVYDIKKSNNTIVLTVGYIPASELAQDKTGQVIVPEPDKFMKVTLRGQEGGHYIIAIQATDAPETISFKQTTAPATTAPATTTQPSSTNAAITQEATKGTATTKPSTSTTKS